VADAPGSARISSDPLRIACPWHGWEYDLESGQSFMVGVRSYGVRLEAGGSLLDEATARPAERVPGPYLAESDGLPALLDRISDKERRHLLWGAAADACGLS
jgi:hypothetical protein